VRGAGRVGDVGDRGSAHAAFCEQRQGRGEQLVTSTVGLDGT
jgi:hypothetical protein